MKRLLAVLLVEDSEADATLLVSELQHAGYEIQSKLVDTADDFSAALESHPWDVILCDYRMPRFDGLAALRLFKERGRDIPFIFVSGAISEELAVEAMRAGAHDYVMKTNLKRLVPAVEREIRDALERREKDLLQKERAAIENEMRRRDALFRSLIQYSSDGILLLSPDGAFIYQSPSAARMLGYQPDRPMSDNLFHLVFEEDRTAVRQFIDRLASVPGSVLHCECRMVCADTSVRWVEAVGHNLFEDQSVGAIGLNYRDITERKTADEELRRSQQQLRALAANLQNAREEERRNISREFHDQVGQSLTALKMGLTMLHREITTQGTSFPLESIDVEIQSMRREIDQAIQAVRTTLSKLRPELLDQLGLLAALGWDIERFQKRSGISCKLESNVEEVPLDPRMSIALFRICQEALTNIARHAKATAVEVRVCLESGTLRLTIQDNGIGVSSAMQWKADSFGLIGMRERALLMNGTLDIKQGPAGGTAVSVTVPLGPVAD